MSQIKGFLLVIILQIIPTPVYSSNILFYSAISSYSHRIAMWPIVESLADRGHNVSFLSPFPPKHPHPKVIELNPPGFLKWWEEVEKEDKGRIFESRKQGNVESDWFLLTEFGTAGCEALLNDESIQIFLRTSTYDLIVIDMLFNECAFGLAHVFNASTIYYSTTSLFPWLVEPFGIPVESSWIPDMVYISPTNMNFWQKIRATFSPLYWQYLRQWNYFPVFDKLFQEKLPRISNSIPKVEEMERNVDLLFINSHFSEEYARSLPPFVVPVGGAHAFRQKPEQLSKELENFISTKDQFIYISLGSYADIFALQPEVNKMFLEVLGEFSQLNFIMKTDAELIKDKPANVFITKWSPQTGVLAHPKIRGFITHSGLLGMQEAIYYAVPLITMPIFAEQDYNAARVVKNELGIQVEISDLTKEVVRNALKEILENKRYGQNMKKMSELFKDRQVSPIDTGVWWIEYILRHRDDPAYHKAESRNQTWYHRRILDIWLLVLLVLSSIAAVILFIVKRLFRMLFEGSNVRRYERHLKPKTS